MFHDGNDIRGVAAARSFGVVGVDGAALEGGNGLLDEAGLVEGVGVDAALDVELIADSEAGVDGGRGRAPVFVDFETACSGGDLLAKRFGG